MTTFYVVGTDRLVEHTFMGAYDMSRASYKDADIIIFTGGADIEASYYHKANHESMYTSPQRDSYEMNMMYSAMGDNKKIFGICRGAQLGHVALGGEMWQDVNNHAIGGDMHWSWDHKTSRPVRTSSCHHQMMKWDNALGGELVCTAARTTYRHQVDCEVNSDNGVPFRDDVEVIWYPDVNLLCYQGHPEYGRAPCTAYAGELMQRFGFTS